MLEQDQPPIPPLPLALSGSLPVTASPPLTSTPRAAPLLLSNGRDWFSVFCIVYKWSNRIVYALLCRADFTLFIFQSAECPCPAVSSIHLYMCVLISMWCSLVCVQPNGVSILLVVGFRLVSSFRLSQIMPQRAFLYTRLVSPNMHFC